MICFGLLYGTAMFIQVPAAGPSDRAIRVALAVVIASLTVVAAARIALPFRSWADTGIWSHTKIGWPRRSIITVAGTASYVAVLYLTDQVTDKLLASLSTPPKPLKGLSDRDPAMIPGDVARSVATSFAEELLLFGLPIGVTLLLLRRVPFRSWGHLSATQQRRLVVALAVFVIVSRRFIGHTWGGPRAIVVFPWLLAAWVIYQYCGRSVWPLVLGHIAYDIAAFTQHRTDDWALETPLYAVVFAGMLLAPALGWVGRRWGLLIPSRR